MTKQELREKVWTMLERKGVARFPDAHSRILKSNFQRSARNSQKFDRKYRIDWTNQCLYHGLI